MSTSIANSSQFAEEEAYTSLLEICTQLIIADSTETPPRRFLEVVHGLLHSPHLSGDAMVLCVRAVRILLEKFLPAFSSKSGRKLIQCLHAALECAKRLTRVQPHREDELHFVHTRRWELQEELLQCMHAAAQSDDAVQAALPPLQELLRFCSSVMDVSLDMALQALRMCSVILRSGQLPSHPGVVPLIQALLRSRLEALETMEMNSDWMRLLRHVVEGLVTLRAYGGRRVDTADAGGKKTRKRMRGATDSSVATSSFDGCDEALIFLRLCQKVCATPRLDRTFRSTVFSCASAILSDPASLFSVSPDFCVAVVSDLARELTRHARTKLLIGNPFIQRETTVAGGTGTSALPFSAIPAAGGDGDDSEEDEERGEDMQSSWDGAKWRVPEPEWPLLILIAKLCAARSLPTAEYMWWWVGDDDYARTLAKEDRAQLTDAFFAARDVVELQKRGSQVHLSTMREFQWPFAVGCRVLLQPVPCGYTATAVSLVPALQCTDARAAELEVALRKVSLAELLKDLGGAALYENELDHLGRAVMMQVLLIAGPGAAQTARAAVRSLFSDLPASVIESVSEALLSRDKGWAHTLLDLEVPETILRRSTTATPERSPVVQMLRREAGSLPSTPPLLPHSSVLNSGPEELRRILCNGGRREVKLFLETLSLGKRCAWDSAPCVKVIKEAVPLSSLGATLSDGAVAPSWVEQLEHLLAGLLVSRLQDMALRCRPSQSLKQTVEAAEVVPLTWCHAGSTKDFVCLKAHPLHHHHGRNWKCDGCGAGHLADAWSCRMCDYDLCAACVQPRCNRACGAVTATAQDLLVCSGGATGVFSDMKVAEKGSSEVFFTEEEGLIAAATPLSRLRKGTLHRSALYAPCPCGLVCPDPVRKTAEQYHDMTLLGALLSAFGSVSASDAGVQRSLVKAFESVGTFIFLGGARAIPEELRELTMRLGPSMPLSLKHLITRYVAVDCRRYAFQHLHDQDVTLFSTNTGIVEEQMEHHKAMVPRHNKSEMLRILHDVFRRPHSLLNKMDFVFEGEEGFGSGPSQELYTEISMHFRSELNFWYLTDDATTLAFPSSTALYLKEFFVLGAACARSFVDEFRMNLDLIPQAWPFLMHSSLGLPLGQRLGAPATPQVSTYALMALLEVLDPSLHRTFTQLRRASAEELTAMDLEMEDGSHIVSHEMLEQHIRDRIVHRFEVSLENLRHFQWGLLSVMEVESLWCLTDEERSVLLCGADVAGDRPLFTEDELRVHTTVGNGYQSGSSHVEMFLAIVGGEFTRLQQQNFLEFLTGSPRLPFNGLAGLGRPITIAMKDMEGQGEQTLPSCNTCFLYLKLPPYSTHDILKERLLFAVTEGRRNYSLS